VKLLYADEDNLITHICLDDRRHAGIISGVGVMAAGQREQLPPPKFWAVENWQKNIILVEKYLSENAKFEAKNLILGKFRGNVEILSTGIFAVGNLPLSVGFFCRKFAVSVEKL